jgi:hypothetical protein
MSDEQDPPEVGGPPAAARFKKGQSGNPGGRPKDLPRFRRACRKLSWDGLEIIKAGLKDPEISFGDKVTAWKAVADRGGHLPVDRQAAIESAQARLVLAMMVAEALTPAERKKLLDAMERSLAGEIDAP